MNKKTVPVKRDLSNRTKIVIQGHKEDSLSPYDIPNSAEVIYNEEKQTFEIEFEYITSEEPTSQVDIKANPNISLWIGKNSGKLYRIKITKFSKVEIPTIKVELKKAIDEVKPKDEKSPGDTVTIMNLDLAKEFLEEEEEEIFATN